jgi:hypothetical protein
MRNLSNLDRDDTQGYATFLEKRGQQKSASRCEMARNARALAPRLNLHRRFSPDLGESAARNAFSDSSSRFL